MMKKQEVMGFFVQMSIFSTGLPSLIHNHLKKERTGLKPIGLMSQKIFAIGRKNSAVNLEDYLTTDAW